ncbi:1-acyl-sn-glycerol-3-phosphate acyltransferase [Nodularia harveyana UHCC-0300]|uniref:1-acyl-sn-glycerol-3-phosphate acyltransferase n=1 Tax=Nodularia harveyana UHCC-0300 TaxID=2974287 RepID=A0ABU5UER2_9CYAN|nr:1-acyl-sn-glycerol-3-phosphate acyltransferase [Nodularia harveyana]MEA5581649.1 1-acyl-sn-glycerol-3-phosphate acyltransferase [Nodularia harveyana UHCC-0300]
MSDAIYQAQPPLEFIPPAFNPLVLRVFHLLLPSWISWKTAISQVEADNVEVLVDLYRQFREGKVRFVLAFRHPKTDDPFCLTYLFSQLVPKLARKQNTALQMPIHAHFIYDRGIPLWAGSYAGWIASRLGGTSIQRGKADWTGLRSARDLFANGRFPMAAAPEGATNGLSEFISPLEPGIAQLGFWCAEDLQKQERSEQVLIIPVGIKYSYVSAPWRAIANLLTELEAASGLVVTPGQENQLPCLESLYPRLLTLAEHLLSLMEDFYKRFYHQSLPDAETIAAETTDRNAVLVIRLQALLDTALRISEEYFNLLSRGQLSDRCRRVEQAGWNYIFREEFQDIKALSPVEIALGDRVAEEANSRMWHMRLVEGFVAVSGNYIREKPTAERFAETTLILWKMIARIKGDKVSQMPQLGEKKVKITIGEPISVSDRYPAYKENRLGARQAVADLTNDLQQELENLI